MIDGGAVLTGPVPPGPRPPTVRPSEVDWALPASVVAVTVQLIALPLSAATTRYVADVAAPMATASRLHW